MAPPASRPDRRAEFEDTCLGFASALYGAALRLTRRREDASDVVQETYLRAYRTFENFSRGTNAKAWLFRILYTVFVNRYRKRRREPVVSMEEIDGDFLDSLRDPGWNLPAQTTSEEVVAAVDALPEVFRSAVVLVDMHGHSYEDAAGILGCPVNTLRSRLSRARKLLFLSLRDYARASRLVRP